jgi:hypothetical protein
MNYTSRDRADLYWLLRQWSKRAEQDMALSGCVLAKLRRERNLARLQIALRNLSMVIRELWVLEHEDVA